MKLWNKIAVWIVCLSIGTIFVPSVVQAAAPQLRFSDPSTTVGATVEVTAKLSCDSAVDTVQATLSYDPSFLNFTSGSGATGSDGQIELSGSGNGASEVKFSMQFQALAEGTTKIQVTAVTATAANGSTLQVTQGNSTITIGPGDPSLITANDPPAAAAGSGTPVEVNGASYTVSGGFSDILIPEGFVRTEVTYEGQACQAVVQESSGTNAIYLKAASGEENFFLYDAENGTFSPFEQVSISQDRYIILLSQDQSKSLPDNYQKTSLTLNGKEFPAWQNVNASEYYLVYGLNADGKKNFYQYDTVDATYQRFTVEKEKKEEASVSSSGFAGKMMDKLKNNIGKLLIGVWALILIFVVGLIVLAVKLYHRNRELDDLYEEYGIDEDDEEDEEIVEVRSARKKQVNAKEKKENHTSRKQAEEDDFYEFEEEEFEEPVRVKREKKSRSSAAGGKHNSDKRNKPYDDEEDEFAAYADMSFEGIDFDDDDIDDLDDLLDARVKKADRPGKAAGSGKTSEPKRDDTFEMDFIDLD